MIDRFITLDYDTGDFPFQALVAANVFRVAKLDQLHETQKRRTGRQVLDYADNLRLRRRLQALPDDHSFYKLYHAWIARVVAPHFGGRISYSAHPKMRVHLSCTGSVSGFHRDAEVTGREDQINCYLPFTDVRDGATLYTETAHGRGDQHPLNLRYGQALLWDGGRMLHGTLANDTGITRVSCDFRFHSKRPHLVRAPYDAILTGRPARARAADRTSAGN